MRGREEIITKGEELKSGFVQLSELVLKAAELSQWNELLLPVGTLKRCISIVEPDERS